MALEDRGGAPGANGPSVATTAYVDAATVLKANTASPTLTGVPRSANPPGGSNDTQIATTSWVTNALGPLAPIDSPVFTSAAHAPTPASTDNGTEIATTAFVQAQKVSPAFTGTPTAPTPSNSDNTTKLATTAFVQAQAFQPSGADGQSSNGSPGWYQRIATLNGGGVSGGANIALLITGVGDYGTPPRGIGILSVAQRGTGTAGIFPRLVWLAGAPTLGTFYTVSTGSFTVEVWWHTANFQFTPHFTYLDGSAATLVMDSATQTAPSGLVALSADADVYALGNPKNGTISYGTNYSATSGRLNALRLGGDGEVTLNLSVTKSGTLASGDTVATLPSGFRPGSTVDAAAVNGTLGAALQILSSGAVTLAQGGGSGTTLFAQARFPQVN